MDHVKWPWKSRSLIFSYVTRVGKGRFAMEIWGQWWIVIRCASWCSWWFPKVPDACNQSCRSSWCSWWFPKVPDACNQSRRSCMHLNSEHAQPWNIYRVALSKFRILFVVMSCKEAFEADWSWCVQWSVHVIQAQIVWYDQIEGSQSFSAPVVCSKCVCTQANVMYVEAICRGWASNLRGCLQASGCMADHAVCMSYSCVELASIQ